MSTLQIPHVLDSVIEDQESSNVKIVEPINASSTSLLSQPMPARKLSFSNRRHSFGLPAVAAAQAAAQANTQATLPANTLNASDTLTKDGTSLSSLTSLSRKLSSGMAISRRASRIEDPDTLKPNLPGSSDSARASSRRGVINIDENTLDVSTTAEKKKPISIPEENPVKKEKLKWKKYNVQPSDRFPVIPKDKMHQKACVGCYDPYPNIWPNKTDKTKNIKDEWARMSQNTDKKIIVSLLDLQADNPMNRIIILVLERMIQKESCLLVNV